MRFRPESIQNLTRPVTLEEGELYWLKLPAKKQGNFKLLPVRFISYTSCPAVIVIADHAGRHFRINRDGILS
jgi:hypothetical protein